MSNRRDMLFSFGETLRLTFINNHTSQQMTITANGTGIPPEIGINSGQTRIVTIFDHYTTIGVYPSDGSTNTRVNGVLGQNFTLWTIDNSPTTVPEPADLIYTCTNA